MNARTKPMKEAAKAAQKSIFWEFVPKPRSKRISRIPFSAWKNTTATSPRSISTQKGVYSMPSRESKALFPPIIPKEITVMCISR